MSWFGFALAAPVLWGMGYLMGEKVLQSGVSASALMFIYVMQIAAMMDHGNFTGA